MKHPIDELIDDHKQAYAYARLQQDRGSDYGHMYVEIFLPSSGEYSYRRPDGTIKISCQIGSDINGDEAMFFKPYAWRYGFDNRFGDGTLDELETAVKTMRKIKQRMDKLYQEIGNPETFADFSQRILIAAGIKSIITEPMLGWGNGGNMSEKELFRVGPGSASRLREMENELITVFSARRRAA